MNRRKSMTALAAATLSATLPAAAAGPAIQLHVDLNVDPSKEKELLKNFAATFQPTIEKQLGFIDVKLMKLRTVAKGVGPVNTSFRLLISFQTEDQRQKWVASDDHRKVWPAIEKTLRGEKLSAVLFDLV